MSVIEKQIIIKNDFDVDGTIYNQNTISYLGTISATYDVIVFGQELNKVIPINFNGVIKRIELTNASCGIVEYKLDNSAEKYILRKRAILTQQPVALKIDNVENINKVIRVLIVGEES